MRNVLRITAAAVLSLAISAGVFAAEPETKVYGYNWFRYTLGYDNAKEKTSAFEVKRTYVRVKTTGEGYEGALTLDYENSAAQTGVNFGTWVKNAYVDLKSLPLLVDAGMTVRVGLQGVPFGTIDTWEYPLIEKAPEDKLKLVDSADYGVTLRGYLPMALGNFEAGILSGSGYKKAEANLDKSVVASLNIVPITGIYVRGSYLGHQIGEDQQVNGQPSSLAKYADRKSVVLGFGSSPISGFVEALESKDQKSSGKSGIGQALAAYLGVEIIDAISAHAMYMTSNPDTLRVRDEKNLYAIGVNYDVTEKVMLQLNYQMEQDKVGGGSSPVTTNLWMAKTKWSW
ncbi:MAG: hypothetical protein BWY84_00002 [Candidatus Aerophobetes bacterium ADurb.Bin490]|nr:MAG: hypothetical protein BWY84_00002 [Candidatus Aerophobetes bacterium ADurb.Bin490]